MHDSSRCEQPQAVDIAEGGDCKSSSQTTMEEHATPQIAIQINSNSEHDHPKDQTAIVTTIEGNEG